ncbi:hypothetical protein H5410_029944 [Solanum commersonii]|uniref:Uncharacterized protein n=1 Tax=Solanum commersonii TaxID=4109 RepID=A0A9J5YHV2_SOLCO|nr:hypothetical protein H5410_029944 [Solanum commersonii]
MAGKEQLKMKTTSGMYFVRLQQLPELDGSFSVSLNGLLLVLNDYLVLKIIRFVLQLGT